MASLYRVTASPALRAAFKLPRTLSVLPRHFASASDPPKPPPPAARGPPEAPREEAEAIKKNVQPASYIGTTKRLPEFNLNDKVVLVSGAARGLGLVQAEALLEAGATVYALDRLETPSDDFYRVQKRAAEELGTSFHYRQVDVRNVEELNEIVKNISDKHGRMDGLIAAAGIQQETSALDYSAKDANTMFEVNITGVFMTAQAVAKEMIRWERGGSIILIGSMSGTVANRVSSPYPHLSSTSCLANSRRSCCRVSRVPPTTSPKLACSNSREAWLLNGANTASVSTPSRPATSLQLWSRRCSSSSRIGRGIGQRIICSAS